MLMLNLPIIADSIDISTQAKWFFEVLLTPTGFVALGLGSALGSLLLSSKLGVEALGALCIFMLTTMRLESRYFDNTLIQPLQTIRDYSRPVSLAIMLAIAARTILYPRGDRRILWTAGCMMLLLTTAYYLLLVGLFADPARAVLGFLAVGATVVAFVLGLGRLMQPGDEGIEYLRMFEWAGLAFVISNLAQLALGYSSAIVQGRLGGISGNPQQFAATCCVFAIIFAHAFASSRIGSSRKWLSAVTIGVIGLFLLWSGSRTGLLCTALSLVAYFRTRIGRFALLALVVAPVLLVLTTTFTESTWGTNRFLSGADTRTGVWLRALDGFARSPVVGELPTMGEEGMSEVESSYLRALHTMGLIGGALILSVVIAMVVSAWKVWIIGRRRPEYSPLADLEIAATAFTVLSNAAEGFLFGILTFFSVFTYAIFAVTAFVVDGEQAAEDADAPAQEQLSFDGR
jgi:hypothetical protein